MAMGSATPTADLMTVRELGAYLGKNEQQVRWMMHAGKAPRSAKIGGRVMFRRREVDAWIEEQFEAASA